MFVSLHGFGKRDHGTADDPTVRPPALGWRTARVACTRAALTLHLRPQAPLFYPSSGRTCGLEGRGDDDGGDTTHIMGSGDEGVKELFEKDVSTPHVVNVGIDRCSSQTQQWRDAIRCVHACCCKPVGMCNTQYCSALVPRVAPRDLHSTKILPQMVEFNPDLILVSAGFDAHREVASDIVGAALLLQGSHTSPSSGQAQPWLPRLDRGGLQLGDTPAAARLQHLLPST